MAHSNYPSSDVVARGGATAPFQGTPSERTGTVIGEFVEAARSAAESLIEEQKRQIAGMVGGVAEGLRSAADPLHRSQNQILARYLTRAAEQVESLTHTLRNRRWNELVADTEEFARRQPTWFVLGAVATGFVVGRLLWASAGGSERAGEDVTAASPSTETGGTVTAAVSSGSGTNRAASYRAGASGVMESR